MNGYHIADDIWWNAGVRYIASLMEKKESTTVSMTNNERIEFVIDDVKSTIVSRGVERDLDDGERTIPRCVKAFNSITGNDLSAEDGWLFMQILKMCRSKQGEFKYDDYRDGVGYAALRAEEALKNNGDNTGDDTPQYELPPTCAHGYTDCNSCGVTFVPPECDTRE